MFDRPLKTTSGLVTRRRLAIGVMTLGGMTCGACPSAAEPPWRGSVVTTAAPRQALAEVDAWICGAPLELERATTSADRYSPAAVDRRAPWVAKLEIIEERFEDGAMTVSNCSATAISDRWLLTAAHCVGQEGWVSVRATLGARDAADAAAVRRTAQTAVCHVGFDPSDLSFDVALLRLSAPLPPAFPTLRVATPAETARLAPDAPVLSAGWGRVSENEISPTMRTARIRVVDPARAKDGMIVAAPEHHEASLCVGESGAPLIADTGFGPALFGVFSSVDALLSRDSGAVVELCHGFEARSYFTGVKGLQGWIDDVIQTCDRRPDLCAPD